MTMFEPVKIAKRARVGLYSIGHARYWDQFEGLLDRLLGYNRFIDQRMAQWGDVCHVAVRCHNFVNGNREIDQCLVTQLNPATTWLNCKQFTGARCYRWGTGKLRIAVFSGNAASPTLPSIRYRTFSFFALPGAGSPPKAEL